eukprot:448179-Amorphochlora_amoeboformis.AAC.1
MDNHIDTHMGRGYNIGGCLCGRRFRQDLRRRLRSQLQRLTAKVNDCDYNNSQKTARKIILGFESSARTLWLRTHS